LYAEIFRLMNMLRSGQFLANTEQRSGHREPSRVQLAALKVASGSVPRLGACIESAKRDYRDAVAAAEYPAYFKTGFRVRDLPAEQQRRITLTAIGVTWSSMSDWIGRRGFGQRKRLALWQDHETLHSGINLNRTFALCGVNAVLTFSRLSLALPSSLLLPPPRL
jgi:hypothetical protein